MTIEELKGDLNRLQGDAVHKIEIVEDEFVAAELLATNSTLESFGVLFDSAIRFGKIGRQQIRYCIDDGQATIKAIQVADSGDGYIDALFSHVGRRVDHVASGFESFGRLVETELDEFSGSVDTSWNLFSRLVNADWSTTAKENN